MNRRWPETGRLSQFPSPRRSDEEEPEPQLRRQFHRVASQIARACCEIACCCGLGSRGLRGCPAVQAQQRATSPANAPPLLSPTGWKDPVYPPRSGTTSSQRCSSLSPSMERLSEL